MSQERNSDERATNQDNRLEFAGMACCSGGPGSSGLREGNLEEMMEACPCGDFLRRHRVAVFTTLAVAGLGVLILQAGWVLGVIAFFRTF
jgi:hypothetical protein